MGADKEDLVQMLGKWGKKLGIAGLSQPSGAGAEAIGAMGRAMLFPEDGGPTTCKC